MEAHRKTDTEPIDELQTFIRHGYLTGQETWEDLEDMNTLDDLIIEEAESALGRSRANIEAEILGIKARFHMELAPLLAQAPGEPLLEVLQPILHAHPTLT